MYTIGDADALIERVKEARPTCPRCTYWLGNMAPLDVRYFPLSHRPGWVMRCDTCLTTKSYPWADRLEGAAVLKFMNDRPTTCFGFEELEKTLTLAQSEWDLLHKQIMHWKDKHGEAAADAFRLSKEVDRLTKVCDQWRERCLQAEVGVANLREQLEDLKDRAATRKATRHRRAIEVQSQLRDLQYNHSFVICRSRLTS